MNGPYHSPQLRWIGKLTFWHCCAIRHWYKNTWA